MDGQIVLVNILPSTYTPQTEPDRGDKPQAGIRHVTTRRNSYALWEAPLAHPAKNLPGHDSPQHPFRVLGFPHPSTVTTGPIAGKRPAKDSGIWMWAVFGMWTCLLAVLL